MYFSMQVLSIEVHATYVTPVKNYMTGEAGYKYITFIQNGYSHDQIYAHKSIMHELDKRVVDGKRLTFWGYVWLWMWP